MTMHRFSVGKDYCLRLPDGRPLGHVHIERLVDSWAEGPFTPAAAFREFHELFEREARLRHEQMIPLWEQAADAIESLKLEVIEEGKGAVQAGVRVFVEGSEAILGDAVPVPGAGDGSRGS